MKIDMTFKETSIRPQGAKKALGAYHAMDLKSLIGGKQERELNLEEQVEAALAEERRKIADEKSALEAAKAEVGTSLGLLKAVLEGFSAEKEAFWQGVQKEMGEVVLLIAQKIIDTEVKTNPEVISKAVESLLAQYNEGEKAKLSLNPEDVAFMESIGGTTIASIKSLKGVELISDESIARGNARLDTLTLRTESGIGKRLEHVWNELSPALPPQSTDKVEDKGVTE